MYKIKNSNIPFVTLSKENMFTICNSLEYDEIGIIFKAFMDFVYFGIEPTFEKKYMQGIFDGVLQTMERKAEGCFASRENGKKGGRPKKSDTELQPNTDFEKEAEISPNKPDFYSDDTEVPQEDESVSEGPIQGEFDNTIEEFENNIDNEDNMGTFIGYIPNFSVETRAEKTEFNVPKFIEYLKEQNNCLYNKMIRTPSKGLNLDGNMERLKECIDGQLKVFLPDNTKRQQVYIYIIENNN